MHRQVGRVVVGTMGLEHFLERIVEGDLVITPGDRVDIAAGSLAATLVGYLSRGGGAGADRRTCRRAVRRLVEGRATPVSRWWPSTATPTRPRGSHRGPRRDHAQSTSKIAAAIGLFEDHVDTAALAGGSASPAAAVTPLMFEHAIVERAKADSRHIVLPEGDDDRVLAAADQLLHRGVADLTALGVERDIRARAAALGLALPDCGSWTR